MKIMLTIIFQLVSLIVYSQSTWAFGVTYQPFIYQNYNKLDWNNAPYSFPLPSYGNAEGLFIHKRVSNLLSIESSFLYSKEAQKHKTSHATYQKQNESLEYIYDVNVSQFFKRIRLKSGMNLNFELGVESNFFVSISGGIQLSYLQNYHFTFKQYEFSLNPTEINYELLNNYIHYSDENNFQKFWDNPLDRESFTYYEFQAKPLFRKWDIGTYIEISLKKKIITNYFIQIGLQADIDFTKTNDDYFISNLNRGGNMEDGNWHNRRYGLLFSLLYSVL